MFTQANGHVLHATLAGDRANPPAILLHSLGTSGVLWETQAERLAATHFVVCPDFRGHGLSEESREPLTVEVLADDVVAIADQLGLGKFVLAGVSIGGMVAQLAAARAAGQVRALAVLDSSVASLDPDMWRRRAAEVRANGLSSMADAILSRWSTAAAAGTPQAAGLRRMLEKTSSAAYAAGCDALALADCRMAAASLRIPTIVAVGDEDAATPPTAARELARAIPGARLQVIEKAAHLPMLERPEVVTKILIEAFA